MFRRVFLFVILLAVVRAGELSYSGDTSDLDTRNGELTLRGHARFTDGEFLLTADEVRYDSKSETATAVGHVAFTRGTSRLLAEKLTLHRRELTFTAESVRFGTFPYFAEAVTASGTRGEVTLRSATVSYREPGPWRLSVAADSLTYAPGQRLRMEKSRAGLGVARLLPLPHFHQELDRPLVSYLSATGGYRSSLGAFVEAGVHVPVAEGLRLGGDVGLYTARGLMAGPSGSYASADGGAAWHGFFNTGFIRDHGERKSDLLGRTIPINRGFAEWQHEQRLAENLTLTGQVNWWRDSEILRDFHPRSFFPVQQPDSFLESVYTGNNYFVSAFARAQPNRFHSVQERLPELRFDLLPLVIGNGFVERFEASYVHLRDRPPGGAPKLESDRLDAYYAITRPFTPREWLSITPVAGARVTNYSHTTGAAAPDGTTRTLGELGVDAALRTSATFDYQNEQWKINGLRHLVTPRLGYRYIPEAARGARYIPAIDRRAFSTYLPPLGLGATRNLDDLRATNVLRLGLDQTLQTRDAGYGSRDLVALNAAVDFRFHREPGERDLSEVHAELAVMPTPWVQLDVYSSAVPQTGKLREFNSGITVRDGGVWSLRFSNNFLRRQLEDYLVEGRARINEVYEGVVRLQYDARKRRFNEQSFGLRQNLDNVWLADYVITLYDGPRRESRFGFNVQVEATGF